MRFQYALVFFSLCSVASVLHSQPFPAPERRGAAHVLAGTFGSLDYRTIVTVENIGFLNCEVTLSLGLGAGKPPDVTLFTNGQDAGSITVETVPPFGVRKFEVTAASGFFNGAATIGSSPPICGATLLTLAEYQIVSSSDGQQSLGGEQQDLVEIFAYPMVEGIPEGCCVNVPVDYDPADAGGITFIPGLAHVRRRTLRTWSPDLSRGLG